MTNDEIATIVEPATSGSRSAPDRERRMQLRMSRRLARRRGGARRSRAQASHATSSDLIVARDRQPDYYFPAMRR